MTFLLQLSSVFPEFALGVAVRCLVLAFFCGGVLWLFRIRSAAVQNAVWRLVLCAMLAAPLATTVMPNIAAPAGLIPNVTPRLSTTPGVTSQLPAENPRSANDSSRGAMQDPDHPAERWHFVGGTSAWSLATLVLYVLVATAMLCRIALGWFLMRRFAQTMRRVDDPHLLDRMNRQCEALDLLIFPEVRAATSVSIPVTFGWSNPVILLPGDWPRWSTEKLDIVLAHELSHIQRHDYPFRILSTINQALHWFNPLAWWLHRRLAELAEHVSDDAALGACLPQRERYVGILNEFTHLPGGLQDRLRLGIAMSVSAVGARRVNRILDQHRMLCSPLNRRQKGLVLMIVVPAFVLFAGSQTTDRPLTQPTAQIEPTPPNTPVFSTGRPRRVPPPMFSRAYTDALQDVLKLEPSDVAALERSLAENPEDFAARLKLIAYYRRADQARLPESRGKATQLLLWLIDHQPDSEILASSYGVLSPNDLNPDQLDRAKKLWKLAETRRPANARAFWNAANFYRQFDRRLYAASLERAVALAPDNPYYALSLATHYAGAILTATPQAMYRDPAVIGPRFASHAREVLDTTQNPYLLEPAVRLLQSEYNKSLMMKKEAPDIGALAQQYFQRAKKLDPGLDESWVYPPIDPKMMGMLAPGARPPDDGKTEFENAAKQIRRLPVDAFPNLPSTVATVLRHRGCLIPQPGSFSKMAPDDQPKNVIRGEFFSRGQAGWAVLCSDGEASSILVFRNDSDAHPEELARGRDVHSLQTAGAGRIIYSREIQVADRAFIMEHYRAYGGPEPPPIDHQGIDDAFLEKGSTTHYSYGGHWLKLTGAD